MVCSSAGIGNEGVFYDLSDFWIVRGGINIREYLCFFFLEVLGWKVSEIFRDIVFKFGYIC